MGIGAHAGKRFLGLTGPAALRPFLEQADAQAAFCQVCCCGHPVGAAPYDDNVIPFIFAHKCLLLGSVAMESNIAIIVSTLVRIVRKDE